MLAFALGAALASLAAAQSEEPPAEKQALRISSAPAIEAASRGPGEAEPFPPKQNPQHPAVDNNWPTDDFGRPLRGCDVPWDMVPPK